MYIYDWFGKYYYQFRYNNEYYSKSFLSLDDTIQEYTNLRNRLKAEENNIKILKENNIIRKNGIPVLYTHDKYGNINGEFFVDDYVYPFLIHSYWSKTKRGYAIGIYNGIQDTLHRHVYKLYYGDIPADKTIDHIKSADKHDNRISNLQAASASQQAQNRLLPKKSCINYIGVVIGKGSFYAVCKKKKSSPFKYVEDAAREYNKTALLIFGDNALINDNIPDTQTDINEMFNKNNISLEYIVSIETIMEIESIFRANPDWKEYAKLTNFRSINKSNKDYYKNKLIEFKTALLRRG